MGMYDYLKVNTNKLPLSEAEKISIGENPKWQTKDLECILSTAEITDEGKLRFLTFKYDWDENASSSLEKLTGKKGAVVTTDEQWIEIEHHGYINFYNSINNIRYEFKAKFTDGLLVDIQRTN